MRLSYQNPDCGVVANGTPPRAGGTETHVVYVRNSPLLSPGVTHSSTAPVLLPGQFQPPATQELSRSS